MTHSPIRDFLVGLFVLTGLLAIAYLSVGVASESYSGPGGLPVFARFDQTGGLKPRAAVVIAGVKVGRVTGISLAPDFRARIDMDLDASLGLPVDSSVSIVTAGLLGDRYISLQLGGEVATLQPGDEITFTESAVILERLIGKFLYNAGDGKTEKTEPKE